MASKKKDMKLVQFSGLVKQEIESLQMFIESVKELKGFDFADRNTLACPYPMLVSQKTFVKWVKKEKGQFRSFFGDEKSAGHVYPLEANSITTCQNELGLFFCTLDHALEYGFWCNYLPQVTSSYEIYLMLCEPLDVSTIRKDNNEKLICGRTRTLQVMQYVPLRHRLVFQAPFPKCDLFSFFHDLDLESILVCSVCYSGSEKNDVLKSSVLTFYNSDFFSCSVCGAVFYSINQVTEETKHCKMIQPNEQWLDVLTRLISNLVFGGLEDDGSWEKMYLSIEKYLLNSEVFRWLGLGGPQGGVCGPNGLICLSPYMLPFNVVSREGVIQLFTQFFQLPSKENWVIERQIF